MTMKSFIEALESTIIPFAQENSEGSYYLAKRVVSKAFAITRLPVTEKQVINFVNCVWEKTNMEVAR